MSELEKNIPEETKQSEWPTATEIITAVEHDINPEDFKPMKEACSDDIGMFLGAVYSYMTEIKGMTDEEAQDYLIKKGLL